MLETRGKGQIYIFFITQQPEESLHVIEGRRQCVPRNTRTRAVSTKQLHDQGGA